MSTYTNKIKLPEINKSVYDTAKLSKRKFSKSSIHNEYQKNQSKN